MKAQKMIANTLVAGAVALAIAGASDAKADKHEKEKCYGVVKAGQNDCADAGKTHSCVGHATVDGSGHEWVALPKGVCEKLVGGSLEPFDGKGHKCEGKGGCESKEGKGGCEGKNGCEGK